MSITSWLARHFNIQPQQSRRDGRRGLRERRRSFLEGLEERRMLAFLPAVDYPTGVNPQAVVSADFNNDGQLDLATANGGDNTVSVLLGDGQGGFAGASHLSVGSNPVSVSVGDFDRDGALDLAVANSGSYDVTILRGNGNGSFQAPSSVPIGTSPASVAVGDFDGDGLLDLGVVSNQPYSSNYYGYYYSGNYSYANVLLGNGGGSFSTPATSWIGYGYHTSSAVADINGDGSDDLATINVDYGALDLLSGDASGYLQSAGSFGVGYYPRSVAAGDADGDGDADLVTANYYDVSVLLTDGAGGLGAAHNFPVGDPASSLILGDFDGDDTLDIAAAGAASAVSILRGRGDGSGGFAPAESFAAGSSTFAIAAGDFNGDTWLDLATANINGSSVSILINDRTWPPAPDSLAISGTSVTEGDSGVVSAVFTVTRSGNRAGTTTVNYSTANGGALAGSDYVAASGTLTFGPGEATQTITILVNGDLTDEWDQGFYVNLSAPSGGVITNGQAFGLIVDNDPPPAIRITPTVSAKEGNNNFTKLFTFTVTLSAASEKEVWVNFTTADGTATRADGDYIARSGTLYFAPGTTSQTISVQVRGDKKRESNERFFVNLSSPTNATIAAAQGIGEILDDDTPSARK